MAQHDAAVGAAEAERVGHRHAHALAPRRVAHEVQVAVRIDFAQVRVDRHQSVANRQCAHGDFDGACGRDQVAHRALGRTDRQARDVGTEHGLDRGAFAAVVHAGGRAVRIQVVDVGGRGAGAPQRLPHRLDRAVAVGRRIGDAVARQRIAVAGQLGVDVRAAPARRMPFLEHQEARAFAQQEAVARRVERAARALRRVVVRRERRQQAEARDADRTDHRIEAAGQHVVDGAAADQLQRPCPAPGRRTRRPCARPTRSRECRAGA